MHSIVSPQTYSRTNSIME